MSVLFIPHCTPPLYSKIGVFRGIHYFLIFALKHRILVLVRTVYLQSMSRAKIRTMSKCFHLKNIILQPLKIDAYYIGMFAQVQHHEFCLVHYNQHYTYEATFGKWGSGSMS